MCCARVGSGSARASTTTLNLAIGARRLFFRLNPTAVRASVRTCAFPYYGGSVRSPRAGLHPATPATESAPSGHLRDARPRRCATSRGRRPRTDVVWRDGERRERDRGGGRRGLDERKGARARASRPARRPECPLRSHRRTTSVSRDRPPHLARPLVVPAVEPVEEPREEDEPERASGAALPEAESPGRRRAQAAGEQGRTQGARRDAPSISARSIDAHPFPAFRPAVALLRASSPSR